METNILNSTKKDFTTNNVSELSNYYNDFIKSLDQFLRSKLYNSEPIYKLVNSEQLITDLNPSFIKESGIHNIRRFKRLLKKCNNKMSVHDINKLLHLINKKILKNTLSSPKVICEKHEKIQKLRKEWKQQQLIANDLLRKYKEEKSNFYKI
jgi:predicted ATPase with chaperone activity